MPPKNVSERLPGKEPDLSHETLGRDITRMSQEDGVWRALRRSESRQDTAQAVSLGRELIDVHHAAAAVGQRRVVIGITRGPLGAIPRTRGEVGCVPCPR